MSMNAKIEIGSTTKELFFKKHFGTAVLGTDTFEFGHTTNGSPYVVCKETNLFCILSWENIIRLALAAGITSDSRQCQPTYEIIVRDLRGEA